MTSREPPPPARAVQGPTGVYIHVPWCRYRCPYCDFYLHVGRPDAAFAARVLEQWGRDRVLIGGNRALRSIYLGGGTPGLLPPADVETILAGITRDVPLEPGAEVTMEVNPRDCTNENTRGWRSAGVTRISLGVQSLEPAVLRFLGRDHDEAEALAALDRVERAGFTTWSADLIFGAGVQTVEGAAADAGRLAQHAPHISAYCLTVEEGTELDRRRKKGRLQVLDGDAEADRYVAVRDALKEKGLAQYEVSSHARPDHHAVHNRLYWQGHTTLGLAPGAVTYIRNQDGTAHRHRTRPDLEAWLRGQDSHVDTEDLSRGEALVDRVFSGLRDLERGIRVDDLAREHGTAFPAPMLDELRAQVKRGTVEEVTPGAFRVTEAGALLMDLVVGRIINAG